MRNILHCDLNNFFASVECLKNPKLKNVPMAVCGDPKLRHGIVLAKNEIAKKYGIYTPETVYSALKKCPNLTLVKGSYEDYIKYSKIVNQIYLKYTDLVEPFSIDESFLDITGSLKLFKTTSYGMAYMIKEEVKQKTGLTISVGVSFNKSLAKLGSDLKKPDAITQIKYENFRDVIYPLPVNSLLYVGRSTNLVLEKLGIKTIGDLANFNKYKLIKKTGKIGEAIYNHANGIDYEEVKKYDELRLPKSISQGMTFPRDIEKKEEILVYLKRLTDNVVFKLRKNNFKCSVIGINIKYSDFSAISRQKKIDLTDIYQDIYLAAKDIFLKNYNEEKVRAITILLTNFEDENNNFQLNMFDIKNRRKESIEKVSSTLDKLKEKYGSNKISFGGKI